MINRVEKQKNGLQYTVFSGFVQFREMKFVVVVWFSFFLLGSSDLFVILAWLHPEAKLRLL